MHTVLKPYPCLPLSATTYFMKVGDTRRLRWHPYSRGFAVMLEVWAPWLLEVILKPRSCGLSASLWAVSISLVVIALWKPKNRVMAHYMMESWTSPQNVTPTLLQLDLITTAMHCCLCLTPELNFPLFLHSCFNTVLKALKSCCSRITLECCLQMILVKASKLTHKQKRTCVCSMCGAINCVEKHHEIRKRLCLR